MRYVNFDKLSETDNIIASASMIVPSLILHAGVCVVLEHILDNYVLRGANLGVVKSICVTYAEICLSRKICKHLPCWIDDANLAYISTHPNCPIKYLWITSGLSMMDKMAEGIMAAIKDAASSKNKQ